MSATIRTRARARRRRFDGTVVVAVLVAAASVAALAFAEARTPRAAMHAPTEAALTQGVLACPSAVTPAEVLGVVSATEGASGSVELTALGTVSGAQTAPDLGLASARVALTTPPADAFEVRGRDALAPGLAATIWGWDPLAVARCSPFVADQWFTGLSAGPEHDASLELVNGTDGDGVVDVEVLGLDGPVDAPALAGIAVQARSRMVVDLGEVVPTDGPLALRVHVVRGQVSSFVRDHLITVETGSAVSEWQEGTPSPEADIVLAGVPQAEADSVLHVANPGDDQVSVEVQLVTASSTITVDPVPTVDVPAHSVGSLPIATLLSSPLAADAVGLRVRATGPVVAAVRSVLGGDVLEESAPPDLRASGVVVVPNGPKQLYLAGASGTGVATVTATDPNGAQVFSQRVELHAGGGAMLTLPDAQLAVTVAPERATVRAAVRVSGNGSSLVNVTEPQRTSRVVSVFPALR